MKRSGRVSFSKAQYALPDNSHCYYILYLFLTSIDKSLEAMCEMHFSVMCKRLRSGDRTREPGRNEEKIDNGVFLQVLPVLNHNPLHHPQDG